jgi:hypothetical protein
MDRRRPSGHVSDVEQADVDTSKQLVVSLGGGGAERQVVMTSKFLASMGATSKYLHEDKALPPTREALRY